MAGLRPEARGEHGGGQLTRGRASCDRRRGHDRHRLGGRAQPWRTRRRAARSRRAAARPGHARRRREARRPRVVRPARRASGHDPGARCRRARPRRSRCGRRPRAGVRAGDRRAEAAAARRARRPRLRPRPSSRARRRRSPRPRWHPSSRAARAASWCIPGIPPTSCRSSRWCLRPSPPRTSSSGPMRCSSAPGCPRCGCACELEGFVFNRLQGAMLREAYALVRDGVASVADIDRIVSDGLGRRWSVIGPFETVDLNVRGGIAAHARAHGPGVRAHGSGARRPLDVDGRARRPGRRRASGRAAARRAGTSASSGATGRSCGLHRPARRSIRSRRPRAP